MGGWCIMHEGHSDFAHRAHAVLHIGCTRFGPRVRGCCSNAGNSSLDNEQLGLHQPYAPYMIRIVLA